MKYLFLISALTISFLFSSMTAQSEFHTIDDMVELAREQNMNLANWQMTIRELVLIQDITSFIEYQTGKGFYIGKKKDGNIQLNRQKQSGLNETLLLVYTNDKDMYHVSYFISSEEYSNEMKKNADNYIKSVKNDVFSQNAQKFSCIFTNFDGIIDFDVLKKSAINRLNLRTIEETREDHFWTWSAHNPKWEHNIEINDEQMNIQIAVKHTENNQSNIIIGTPILISEY
ncbi:hypothetical protein GGQ92_002444 [Gracilibacillus halotolerans]|uniref:TATA-box binding n=1 Tax=Gracilibacillus halotolerans TaxID=74386 RepID=A0A841RHI0_9BACI|nr:YwmB family TATA-box binding protein [Gracilibacillus halotolerans]MBB6513630.1 hypothetical protein [Gracilibacillus halotolerans]